MTALRYFRVESSGDTLVFSAISELDATFCDHMYEECDNLLEEVARRGAKHAVIDLGSLDYFGAIMLQLLIVVWRRVHADGGKLVVCNVSSIGRQVLHAAKLDSIWAVVPSRAEALAAVQA